MTQPSLFISHGAPTMAMQPSEARDFLVMLGQQLERPDAIVIASAHDEAEGVVVRAPDRFRTWHDFGNFDPKLFEMRYEPTGAKDVADTVQALLEEAGLAPIRSDARQLDHGSWVPLSLLFPHADVPVVTVSVDPRRDAAWHEAIGRVLAPLRERNVLVIGSGSISHNLREVFGGSEERAWVERFTAWVAEKTEAGDLAALLGAMTQAPDAVRNHPTDEHFLPFYVGLGAGGGTGKRIHHSYTFGVLGMDVYAFGDAHAATGLAAAAEAVLQA